jgi:hypothetical protein
MDEQIKLIPHVDSGRTGAAQAAALRREDLPLPGRRARLQPASSSSFHLFLQQAPAFFRRRKRHRQGGEFVMKTQRIDCIGRLE